MRIWTSVLLASLGLIGANSANASGFLPQLIPTDILAGQRLQTGDATVTLFTSASTGGNSRTGPWHYAFKRKIPLGALNGATAYSQCKLTFSNWIEGPGTNLALSASGNTSGSATITVSSTAGIWAGQLISMTGFATGTRVLSITDSTHLVANQNATSTNASVTATFTSIPNYYTSAAGEVDSVGDALTIGNVGFLPTWSSGGQPIQVYFQGQKTVQVPPGASVDSDWFAVSLNPASAIASEERHDVWFDAQTSIYGNEVLRLDLNEGYDYAAANQSVNGSSLDQSLVTSPSYSKTTVIYGYGPTALTCRASVPANANRSFIIIGDSKGRGAWDVYLPSGTTALIQHGDSNGHVGWISRLLANNGYSYINASQSSKWLANFVTNPTNTLDLIKRGNITDAILELGVNDAANSQSAATMEASFQSAVAILNSVGVKVWAVTIGTETTTTDGGATTGNQTAAPGFTVGGAAMTYNDWLRSIGAPTYTGGRILDEADAEMSGRDSQVWRVDYHPFADWFGTMVAVSFVGGSGGTNGTYPITATGGGCSTEPAVSATVASGTISAVTTTNVGAGCTSAPSFSTTSIAGLSGGSITATLTALRTGVHPRSLTDLAGSTVDANGLVATYLQSQFASELPLP